jgi:hypothetical protein
MTRTEGYCSYRENVNDIVRAIQRMEADGFQVQSITSHNNGWLIVVYWMGT